MTKETTRVFLNTWGLYNMGCEPHPEYGYLGYGWMTASEAKEFIESDPERDGGEWFIADIDNYLGIKISSCDYCDVMKVLETIEALEDMDEWERDEIIALMEYIGTDNASEAIEQKDRYSFYADIETYHDFCDELVEMEINNNDSILTRYFDYESYHRDCDFDIHEMSNGVCIAE